MYRNLMKSEKKQKPTKIVNKFEIKNVEFKIKFNPCQKNKQTNKQTN